MSIIEPLIKDKLNLKNHNASDINYIVNSYLNNKISDDEMTSWLKAIFNNGMNIDETIAYTSAIINSGTKLQFNNLNGYIVDKHSTGGIGDKVSIILGPILAACDCYVPMIVGRHLGHTGGTLDKLESIPGYNGLLSTNRFQEIVQNVGISIIGQTDEICPADRKIYTLRGQTNTVASFPLICGSIMSKKIAEGIQGLVLDIKTGNGAFIPDSKEAKKLGNLLSLIGSEFNVDVNYTTTDMNQPLGNYAGLRCEVYESIKCLKGDGPKDLMDVIFHLGEIALTMAGQNNPRKRMVDVINDGSAFEILCKMIFEHGGDYKKINFNYKHSIDIIADSNGYFKYIDTKKIGEIINFLTISNDRLDNNAGIKFFKKNGDSVKQGDIICRVFSGSNKIIESIVNQIKETYAITY
jgi:pyrimidine-nucleoside phosphorylase